MAFNVTSYEELLHLQTDYEKFLNIPSHYTQWETYQYTMILPAAYYEVGTREKWIRVGFALYSMGDIMFISWVLLSAKQDSFVFGSIVSMYDQWCTFDNRDKGFTRRSIKYWAKDGDITAFAEKVQNTINYYLSKIFDFAMLADKATKLPHDIDIANLIYFLYSDEYVCTNIKSNTWYKFEDHRWIIDDSGRSLCNDLGKVRDMIYRRSLSINIEITNTQGDSERSSLNEKRKILNTVAKLLGTNASRISILNECKRLFYSSEFCEKLDNNPMIMCFINGVVDFERKIFRKGIPEDYLTKCTRIIFIGFDSINAVIRAEIHLFMRQLFPCTELLHYMWEHLASILIGKQKDQTIHMYTGAGQNGKSVLVNLMGILLGDYKGDVPLSLLTQSRTKIGGLSPELLELKGTRMAVIQEPSMGDVINEGVMKQLTGGDKVQARSPYNPTTTIFVPQFKLIICSNCLMEIKTQDHGTWRRVRVCEFEALFTDNPVHDNILKPYQFLLDVDIADKFSQWKETFMVLLIEIVFETEGRISKCSKVMNASMKYKHSQNVVSDYMNTYLSKDTESENSYILKQALYEKFCIWYFKNHGASAKPPSMKEFASKIDEEYVSNNNSWRSIKILSE
jgi:P4 family phage/plasmid primase-like protien